MFVPTIQRFKKIVPRVMHAAVTGFNPARIRYIRIGFVI